MTQRRVTFSMLHGIDARDYSQVLCRPACAVLPASALPAERAAPDTTIPDAGHAAGAPDKTAGGAA